MSTITPRDKLKLLDQIRNHVGSLLGAGRNRTIFNAIERDIRAQKGDAPASTRAPSNPNSSGEGGSSIAASALERKIRIRDDVFHVFHNIGAIDVRKNGEHFLLLAPDEARDLAAALNELADDIRQDTIARAWSKSLLEATTE